MKNILCISESEENILNFVKNVQFHFFSVPPLDPEDHKFTTFHAIYEDLSHQLDLSSIDLIIGENIESLPLIYLMRKQGYFCPAILIPHTNAYPLNILFYFLLLAEFSHPDDVILCGSMQAAHAYQKIVSIQSLPICTFGIKKKYKRGNKELARNHLNLPTDKKILLYTGRFMNDKGLVKLLDIYDEMKKSRKDLLLVLCVSHIDPLYFNSIAARLHDTILFYRLREELMLSLYQSADLFVSVATSIFETYGKSPMEAIACGVPAILPNWDGFRYYINSDNGSLVNVFYSSFDPEVPYSFAEVEISDFVQKSLYWLDKGEISKGYTLPDWAYYEETMLVLNKLTQSILSKSSKFFNLENNRTIAFEKYPKIIKKICDFYGILNLDDLENVPEQLGLIDRTNPGDMDLIKELHDELFQTMDETREHIHEIYSNLLSI